MPTPHPEPSARTTREIEEELAHLRRTTDDLSDVVARQAQEIAVLTRRVTLLIERAAEAEAEQGGGAVFTEKPPHY
ncbi:MAG: SlyX family protein [Pseudomonadota bacterium]